MSQLDPVLRLLPPQRTLIDPSILLLTEHDSDGSFSTRIHKNSDLKSQHFSCLLAPHGYSSLQETIRDNSESGLALDHTYPLFHYLEPGANARLVLVSLLCRFNLWIDHELVCFLRTKAGWRAVSLHHRLQLYMSTAVAPELATLHRHDFWLRPFLSVFLVQPQRNTLIFYISVFSKGISHSYFPKTFVKTAMYASHFSFTPQSSILTHCVTPQVRPTGENIPWRAGEMSGADNRFRQYVGWSRMPAGGEKLTCFFFFFQGTDILGEENLKYWLTFVLFVLVRASVSFLLLLMRRRAERDRSLGDFSFF